MFCKLVLDLRQPAAEVGVLRLEVGDPLLQGGDVGQDGGLGLGSGSVFQSDAGIGGGAAIPPTTMRSYRRFGLGTAPGPRKTRTGDEVLNSYCRRGWTCRVGPAMVGDLITAIRTRAGL